MEKKQEIQKKQEKLEKQKKQDMLKFEIAKELGLGERVLKFGWKSLSAKETGRIGGLVSKRKKALQDMKQEQM